MHLANADPYVLAVVTRCLRERGLADDEAMKAAEAQLEAALSVFQTEFVRARRPGATPSDTLRAAKAATRALEAWTQAPP